MFSLQQVLFSTMVGTVASLVVLFAAARLQNVPFDVRNAAVLSLLVGASILVWRLGANIPQMNDDLIPVTSPNDVLCPVVTYVTLSVYTSLTSPANEARSRRDRALLTLVSLIVNIVTI
jgi:hypothetical protein